MLTQAIVSYTLSYKGSLAWRSSRGETGETATTENLMSKLELNDWSKYSVAMIQMFV